MSSGAKLVAFGDWEMPVQYEGISEEHPPCAPHAGMFDVSHMGEVEVEGPGALAFLQRVLSNDVAAIAIGGAQYSCLCDEDGGVLDDLFAYRLGGDRYLIVTNSANHETDLEWLGRWSRGPTSPSAMSPTATRCWPCKARKRARSSPRTLAIGCRRGCTSPRPVGSGPPLAAAPATPARTGSNC